SQLMHSSRNARARASPSMAWRTSPPSRTSMIGIGTSPGVAGAVMSLPTQDGLGAFNDIARRIRCRRDQLLHRFAWGRLEFLARLLDLDQEVGIFQHRIESRPQGLYPVRRNSGRREQRTADLGAAHIEGQYLPPFRRGCRLEHARHLAQVGVPLDR